MAFDLSPLPREQQVLASLPAPPGVEPNFENPPNQKSSPRSSNPSAWFSSAPLSSYESISGPSCASQRASTTSLLCSPFGLIGYICCVYDVTHSFGFLVHQYHVIVRDIMAVQRVPVEF
ncbi:hypothetical protein S7711_10742 [Stachybotrys chartarum IBT 7711]|uniref:Uncharacterized protein n=1 Tax=Stachybotrys chartarum (strain CBS 109288 / IBT 7711) TaxID=1280523 RepID=A0A084AH04_STACB|nr:hypothetical protein S7711_10742 [Stachybotrys chartarum IBT 7711]KFA55336.1 hypothetical protein S40293_11330 [Stachybotrys chartarum IBT 40293]